MSPHPIYINTSWDTSSTFSFQDALSTYGGYSRSTNLSGTLFHSGCVIDLIPNCTAACQDVNHIFADPYTLQNCMVMASLQQSLIGDSDILLDGLTLPLANDFSIKVDDPNFQSLAKEVNQTTQDCLHQYLGTADFDRWGPWYTGGTQHPGPYDMSFPDICGNASAPLNADIGGIGVRQKTFLGRTACSYSAGLHLLLDAKRNRPFSFPGSENLRLFSISNWTAQIWSSSEISDGRISQGPMFLHARNRYCGSDRGENGNP